MRDSRKAQIRAATILGRCALGSASKEGWQSEDQEGLWTLA
jgi:hypothetical protein